MEMKRKPSGRDIAGFLLLGLSVMMLGKSLMLCFSSDIWYDELFTVGMVEHSYGEMVRFTAADVHPPLYYCMVKLFVDLCKLIVPKAGTVIPAKLVSVLPYFILFLYAVIFIRKRFGMFAGGLFLFCVTAMPQLSAYTVEVRMYGWALLFVTAAFLHSYALTECYVNPKTRPERSVRETDAQVEAEEVLRKAEVRAKAGARTAKATKGSGRLRALHGAALVLCGLAAAYTQYFACVAVGMVYLWLLLNFVRRDRKRIGEWLLYVAISVAGYVPWLSVLAGQLSAVSENYWILPLTWRSLGGCVKFLLKPAFADDRLNAVLAVVLFASYLVLWCWWALKLYHNRIEIKKNSENIGSQKSEESDKKCVADEESRARFFFATVGIGVLAGLVAFGFAASFLIRPIFVYRYMIPAAGCFWMGFALCLNETLCKHKAAQTERQVTYSGRHYNIGRNRIAYSAGILLTVLVVIVGLRDYRAFMGEEEYKIRLMAETEKALAMIGPRDSVLYNFDQVQAVTGYYLPETTKRYLWCGEAEKLIQEITSTCGTVEDVENIRGMLKKMREEGQESSLWFIGSFNSREEIVAKWRDAGLKVEEMGSFLLERYWFNLYKISEIRT